VQQRACGCSSASARAPALKAARTLAPQVAPPDAPLIVQVRRSEHDGAVVPSADAFISAQAVFIGSRHSSLRAYRQCARRVDDHPGACSRARRAQCTLDPVGAARYSPLRGLAVSADSLRVRFLAQPARPRALSTNWNRRARAALRRRATCIWCCSA
jgi:hypothetical protein